MKFWWVWLQKNSNRLDFILEKYSKKILYFPPPQDADLRSAVCLEQAAHAFLRSKPSMPRKYALHLILEGNRYARAAQVSSFDHLVLTEDKT